MNQTTNQAAKKPYVYRVPKLILHKKIITILSVDDIPLNQFIMKELIDKIKLSSSGKFLI
jgi:hypothetical protein